MTFSTRLPWAAPENPQSRLETALRARGRPVLDLTNANATTVGLVYPEAAMAEALADARAVRYAPSPLGAPDARAAVAADYRRRGAPVDPEHVVLTASSSESYALLFKLFADPGDVVLVPEPSYPLFEHLARLDGVVPRAYHLAYDGRWHIDFSTLDLRGARAIVAVSPNNPTGSYLSVEDLGRLDAAAAEAGVPLIVDEVFADYPLAPPADAVRAVAAHRGRALTVSLGGLSKSCGLPGLKLGWMAVGGPSSLVRDALPRMELICDTYLSVGAPVQLALPRLLALGAGVRAQIVARITENHGALAALVTPDSPCSLLRIEGGWSAILRVPQVFSDEEWALRLLHDDGVLVQPGYFFDLRLGATLVVSLLPESEAFSEGATRLVRRVGRFG